MQRYEKIKEPIDVYSISRKGLFLIRAFKWKNRVYKISRNNLVTKARKGATPVYLFAVSNESGAYRIRLDTDSLEWTLDEVLWEE